MAANIRPKLVLIANTAWNLWNFRRSLIETLLQHDYEVVCLAPEDGFEENLRSIEGIRFHPLQHLSRKSRSPLSNLRTLIEITRLLHLEKPSLVVLYTIKPNIFGAFAARLLRIPAIATIEGLGYTATATSFFRQLIFILYRFAFQFVKKVVFLNEDDRNAFLSHHVATPDKTVMIKGTGVDTALFYPEGNPAPGQVFLYIGRLLSDKGIREFVQAAGITKKNNPQTRFQILGSTDAGNPASIEPAELLHWIENQHIEYLGSTHDVRPFIAGASVVVLPSYREGMPRVLLEGMSMGKPVITTDSAGCRETVDEGKNGFIVPSENAGALAGAMQRFLHLTLAQQVAMGRYSRQKAVSEFSNNVILPQYVRLIQGILFPNNR